MIGIDEVGRGCWAGPLVAAAVRLHQDTPGLADSKALSAGRRMALAQLLEDTADIGIGWVSSQEVDEWGLTRAVACAMERAVDQLDIAPNEEIIIDGNFNYLPDMANVRVIIKADATIPAVSAASIVAKVARDTYMAKLGQQLPQYGFEKHVGYGTKQHIAALQHYGVSAYHRRSYKPIRALLG